VAATVQVDVAEGPVGILARAEGLQHVAAVPDRVALRPPARAAPPGRARAARAERRRLRVRVVPPAIRSVLRAGKAAVGPVREATGEEAAAARRWPTRVRAAAAGAAPGESRRRGGPRVVAVAMVAAPALPVMRDRPLEAAAGAGEGRPEADRGAVAMPTVA